jgi:nucleoside-diphosphate-sugar epimerase
VTQGPLSKEAARCVVRDERAGRCETTPAAPAAGENHKNGTTRPRISRKTPRADYLEGMRIAISGGKGRLAPGLAGYLGGLGHEVVLCSRSPSVGMLNLNELLSSHQLGRFDAVLHLGWSTVPLTAEETPEVEQEQDLSFVRGLVDEEAPCRPLGRYAAAKLDAERILLGQHGDSCVLRITNVVGSWCPQTRPQGIIPVLVRAVVDGSLVRIWGDGSAVKDYLAASDLHRAVEAVLTHDSRGVFNVASGHSLSVNELITLVENAHGRPIRQSDLPRCSPLEYVLTVAADANMA